MVDRGRSPIRAAKPPSSQRGGEVDPRKSGHLRAGDTSEFSRSELNELLAQEAQADDELGSSTVRLEADELDVLLEKARQKIPAPRAQLATQPYDQVTAFVLLEKDHDDTTPTTPAAEPALEDEPAIDVDEGEPVERTSESESESSPALAPPTPAAITPEEPPPTPPLPSAPLPIEAAVVEPRAALFSADLGWPDAAHARSRQLRARILLAILGALALAALLYFALAEAAPTSSPAPPGEPASEEARPGLPAR